MQTFQLFLNETLLRRKQRLQLTCCAEAGGDLGETVTRYLGQQEEKKIRKSRCQSMYGAGRRLLRTMWGL